MLFFKKHAKHFFHAKATKAFFTKNIYITMAFFWKYISAFSPEMYKKIY